MNALRYLLALPWVEPLGWTLIHFLWQGALIGLGAVVLLRITRHSSSASRYLMAYGLLLLCLAAPVATFVVLARPPWIFASKPVMLRNAPLPVNQTPPALPVPSASENPGTPVVQNNPAAAAQERPPHALQPAGNRVSLFRVIAGEAARWIVPVWLIGVVGMGVRLGTGWGRIQLWRLGAVPLPGGEISGLFTRLASQMNLGNRVRLLLSDKILTPLTMGWIKPVVLLPAQVLTGLSSRELEAILAHELAHIARHDYLANLLQSAIEVILFYHPAVWWLGHQIRDLREECCDEIVLQLGADRLAYAKALAGLAEFHLACGPALAAGGGTLLNRISRLLGHPRNEKAWSRGHGGWALSLAAACVTGLIILYSGRLMASPENAIAITKGAPSGQVVDAAGNPVAGASLLLYYRADNWGLDNRVVEKTVADSQGRFKFTHALTFKTPHATDRHDTYTVISTHDGFAPAWAQVLGGTPEIKELRLQHSKPVSQAFEVVDLQGKPVQGAAIWLRYAGAQLSKPSTFTQNLSVTEDIGICHGTTDANGRVTLDNLPDTQRSLSVSNPGSEDETECTTPSNGIPRYTVKPAAVLEGRVTDPLGMPVEGATVWLYPKFRYHVFFMARTDKSGRYRIDKIWANRNAKGWGTYEAGIRSPSFAAPVRDVSFTSGQTITGFDFKAVSGTEVKGELLDFATQKPVAGAEINVDSSSGRQIRVTDNEGRFTCRVVDGKLNVFFGSPPGGTYVLDERSSDSASSIQTHAFGTEFPVTLQTPAPLGKLEPVRGIVLDATGKPAAYSQVSAAMMGDPQMRLLTMGWSGNFLRGVYTREDGSFTINLPAGMDFILTAENAAGDQSGILQAKLAPGPFEMPSPVAMQSTQAADVFVVDLAGKPRPNFGVEVTPLANGVPLWIKKKSSKTSADGLLHLEHLNPGLTYKISQAGSSDHWTVFYPQKQAASPGPLTLLLTDRYILRVADAKGLPVPIKGMKEFFVWILNNGKRVRWTDSPVKVLEPWGNEVTLRRKDVALAKPGDAIDMLLETKDGELVRASGNVPADGDGILLAKTTQTTAPDYTDDPSIANVQPDEIAGRIVDPEGKPLPGATIIFNGVYWPPFPSNGEPRSPVFTTDTDGIFRVPQAKDKWLLYETISKEGFGPVFLTDIPLGKGFVVKMQNTTRFSGTIGGDRPGKVSLLLEKEKDTQLEKLGHSVPHIMHRTETDENGAYNFPIEAGSYHFKAISADGRFATGEAAAVPNQSVAIPATLQSGLPVTFELTDCQTEKPVSGIEIEIMEQGADHIYRKKEGSKRTSDANGQARWDNLMPGRTQFTSRSMEYALPGKEQISYSRWWWKDTHVDWEQIDYAKQKPTLGKGTQDIYLDVKSGMEPIRILMEKGVKISGTVTGPDGTPQKHVEVGVVPNNGYSDTLTGDSSFSFNTDQDGKFSGYIPAGNGVVYNLCAYFIPKLILPPGTKPAVPSANAVSEPFKSKPGDELTFELKMLKGGWVTGSLLPPGGKPVAGLQVTATNRDHMDLAYAKRIAATDMEGNFRLGPLRPGHYTIQSGTGEGVPLNTKPPTPDNSREMDVTDGEEKNVGVLPLAR